jgi:uncharacterized protein
MVIDTRSLGRRAGSMRLLRRSVPCPEGVALPLVGVPAQADLALDLRLEAVLDGVLVTGTVAAPLVGECGRCLTPVQSDVTAPVQELYCYEAGADDEPHLVGDLLDLEPAVRDAVLLALPISPLCRSDCPGLCATCGIRLAEAAPGHAHRVSDPRWDALRSMRSTQDEES